ncbi:MAG: ketoacyl-ACP synthase III [candidate division Zixibacteria bacterium]|nr:ketoacyl-ACP synthase III [candidate division Zixibacteria bacterium]
MTRAKIIGTGSYVPERVLSNLDLEKMVDTSDEWIKSRSGISERRIAGENQSTSDLCVEAAKKALEMANMNADDIDLLMVATVTPDFRLPSVSCVVQDKLGLINAASMDIVAACAGFIHSLSIAQAYIANSMYHRIMIIGAEELSSITNYKDRNTCVLFGDGAGAAIVTASDDDSGILSTYLKSDGRLSKLLYIPAGGVAQPYTHNGSGPTHDDYFLSMNGNEIYKHAVRSMGNAAERVIKSAGLESSDIDWLVPHQANIRIIQATAKRIGLPMEKVFINLEKYGNTSAASIPLALDEAVRSGVIKKNDNIVSAAFGGGLTWGAVLFRW